MSDLGQMVIYDEFSDLNIKHTEIQIQEKKSLIKGLRLRLEDITNIEISKIELEISRREIEQKNLEEKLKDLQK